MNEINNMSFLTADSKSKMSKVRTDKEEKYKTQLLSSLDSLLAYSVSQAVTHF